MRTVSGGFRADLEGLRGLAVAAVLAYHAAPAAVPGGFAGVDVFFVMSGFLIAGITLAESDRGVFSLASFYARRIRRLVPALVVVLAATLALGWFYLLPHEFVALGKHVAAGASYASNFALKGEVGYFDAMAEEKPLLHLWSLAVEAQFYVLWPIVLLALRSTRLLTFAVSAAALASMLACIAKTSDNQAAAFFLPQYRLWELCAGVLLALALRHRSPLPPRAGAMLAAIGISLLIAAFVLLESRQPYPGWRVLIPVVATMAIITGGSGPAFTQRLLAFPLFTALGAISYSLYLWHWPLLSFAHVLKVADDWHAILAAVSIALVLSLFTYHFVEQPFRHARSSNAALGCISGAAIVGFAGALVMIAFVPPRLSSGQYADLSAAVKDWTWPEGLERDRRFTGIKVHRSGNGEGAVVFVGDSHAQQYWPRVEELSRQAGKAAAPVVFVTRGGCPPITGLDYRVKPDCLRLMERALSVGSDRGTATVVFAAAWNLYFTSDDLEMPGVGRVDRLPGRDAAMQQLTADMRSLVERGKTVFLVLGSPVGLSPLRRLERAVLGAVRWEAPRVDRPRQEHKLGPIREALRKAAKDAGALVIDPMQYLCSSATCEGLDLAGHLIYRDEHHLRSSYVREQAIFIDPVISASGSIR